MEVIHQKGNIPRKGKIIDASVEKRFLEKVKGSKIDNGEYGGLAFYGENNYFEWLKNAEPYLTHVDKHHKNRESYSHNTP